MADTLPKPDYATKNMRLVGYSDQDGRCDGVQIMVHRGYAYIGHIFSKGFSVVDVRDPTHPKVVKYVAAPPNTWTLHLQAHDDLLLVIHNKDMFAQPELADEKNYYKGSVDHHAKPEAAARNWSAGMAVYDISKPDEPRSRSASCRSRAPACIASGMSAGAGPTPRRCSTASPTTSSSPST